MIKIKGFKNYFATTCGKIISGKSKRFMSEYLDTVGYRCVSIRNNEGEIKHMRVHRLIGFSFFNINKNNHFEQVNHKDGNKLNCCVLNLEITSNKENTEHGYDTNLYTTRNKIEIKVVNKTSNESFVCKSMRECEKMTSINRKLISLYIKGLRNNVSNYDFHIVDFDKPFRIEDDLGNDFRSCRQCSTFYGFDEKGFASKAKISEDEFYYKNIKFMKYYVQ